ncbi:MAG: Rha family transcriptional regulator [Alphaproteobacteria bacterium]|nr:Rha family transcriptional regulator [Alphaproteobacteria bacterium]
MTNESMGPNGPESNMPVVFDDRGVVKTNSLDVATYFGKRHDNVVRDVRRLIMEGGALKSEETPLSVKAMFALSEYIDEQGKLQPCYDVNRDGFLLLTMGYTGKTALRMKLAYMGRFNAMEAALRDGATITAMPSSSSGQETEARKLEMVREARLSWGDDAGREVWVMKGLPLTDSMRRLQRQMPPPAGEGRGRCH